MTIHRGTETDVQSWATMMHDEEIARLRGQQSYGPSPRDVSLEPKNIPAIRTKGCPVSDFPDDLPRALFHVDGARLLIEKSGEIVDAGLQD
jgi:hypothetical protein